MFVVHDSSAGSDRARAGNPGREDSCALEQVIKLRRGNENESNGGGSSKCINVKSFTRASASK